MGDSGPKKEGRELDALVATEVMGWVLTAPVDATCGMSVGRNRDGSDAKRNFCFDGTREIVLPQFSTRIDDAWRVVEKMCEHPNSRFRTLRLTAYSYSRTYATFDAEWSNDDSWVEANGDHATPLAICLAALEACSVIPQGETHD